MIVVTKRSRKAMVAELFAAGFTDAEIVARTGLNKQTVYGHRCDLGLLRTKPHGKKAMEPSQPDPSSGPKGLMELAKDALLSRLVEKPDGWYLDGRLSSLQIIIPAANEWLKSKEKMQIGPSHWRIP